MELPLNKSKLRRQILKKRQSLTNIIWQEKSDRLCQNLQALPLFQEAKTILAYFSIRREPDLTSLFTPQHRWGFPRCVDNSLVWHTWFPGEALTVGNYGILEPDANAPLIKASDVDLLLIPAVACDYQGYRLGYGGGFYDRLLNSPQWQSIPTVGIVFDFAYVPQLPIDPWDQRLKAICTEFKVLSIYA